MLRLAALSFGYSLYPPVHSPGACLQETREQVGRFSVPCMRDSTISKVHLKSGWIKYALSLGSQRNRLFFFFVDLGDHPRHARVRRKRSGNERPGIENEHRETIEPLIGSLYLKVTSVLLRGQNCGGTVLSHVVELYIKLSYWIIYKVILLK